MQTRSRNRLSADPKEASTPVKAPSKVAADGAAQGIACQDIAKRFPLTRATQQARSSRLEPENLGEFGKAEAVWQPACVVFDTSR